MTNPEHPPGALARFSASLGVTRRDGWLGGVCAGVAHRIDVDPVVVRGALVVATLLGLPGLWIYAIAWALLPDARGRIQLLRPGVGLAGPVISAFLALVGTTGGIAFLSLLVGASMSGLLVIGIVVLAVVALACGLLVWAARRPGAYVDAVPEAAHPDAEAPTGVDLEEWRAGQEAWRARHQEWRIAQGFTPAQVRAMDRARRRDAVAESRLGRPRASLTFVLAAVGAAALIGAVAWFAFQAHASDRAFAGAALAAAGTFALAMIAAAVMRRRSGILAFLAIASTLVGGAVAVPAVYPGLVLPSAFRYPPEGDYAIVQPVGDLVLQIDGGQAHGVGTTTVQKGSGRTEVTILQVDIDVVIEVTLGDGQLVTEEKQGAVTHSSQMHGDTVRWTHESADPNAATRVIIIDQKEGDVRINALDLEGQLS